MSKSTYDFLRRNISRFKTIAYREEDNGTLEHISRHYSEYKGHPYEEAHLKYLIDTLEHSQLLGSPEKLKQYRKKIYNGVVDNLKRGLKIYYDSESNKLAYQPKSKTRRRKKDNPKEFYFITKEYTPITQNNYKEILTIYCKNLKPDQPVDSSLSF